MLSLYNITIIIYVMYKLMILSFEILIDTIAQSYKHINNNISPIPLFIFHYEQIKKTFKK